MVKNKKNSSKTYQENRSEAGQRDETEEAKINRGNEKEDPENMQEDLAEEVKEELRSRVEEQEDLQEQEEENIELIIAAKLREQEDRYLRLAAEFDNYRKRTLREKAEMTKTAGADIIYDMLPVIDDLDRAIEAMASAQDIKAVRKGIEIIQGKFRDFLAQKGVKEIRAAGTEFDTDFHEAITKIPAPSKKDKGKVVDVIEKGYQMDGRVIRYAKVVVGE